jgi:hypothetical protein
MEGYINSDRHHDTLKKSKLSAIAGSRGHHQCLGPSKDLPDLDNYLRDSEIRWFLVDMRRIKSLERTWRLQDVEASAAGCEVKIEE